MCLKKPSVFRITCLNFVVLKYNMSCETIMTAKMNKVCVGEKKQN